MQPITEKIYYSISETAVMLDESVTTVRFWEGAFEQIKPKKNKRGVRYFTQKDIEVLKQIKYFSRQQGYTLEGVKQKLSHNPNSVDKTLEVIHKLKAIRCYLTEIKETL